MGFILDLKNVTITKYFLEGYVELSYQFASFIAFGTYTIRCKAQQSESEKTFLVDFFCKICSYPNYDRMFVFSVVSYSTEKNRS